MKNRLLKISFISMTSLMIIGCEYLNTSQTNTTKTTTQQTTTTTTTVKPTTTTKPIITLMKHNPTTFDASSYKVTKTTNVGDGVVQYEIEFKLNSGKTSKVVATEVDLSLANIVSGSPNNATSFSEYATIVEQVAAYEVENPNVTVLAASNADFFGANKSVNAFVKDGVIVKNSHNDNYVYDYTNLQSDVPASMPMLFGVSGDKAQIAPIIQSDVKKDVIKSKLFYELNVTNDSETKILSSTVLVNFYDGSLGKVNIVFDTYREAYAPMNTTLLKVERQNKPGTKVYGKIIETTNIIERTSFKATDEYFYVSIPNKLNITDYKIGDILSYNVNSADNTWRYYDNIIGCRQALVIDGEIPNTVKKENTNGAQSTNIPRTAIGIKPDGKVVLFSVESLRYGRTSSSDSDPYGLSLPELADFMRYYGVYSGANFDGGGSTQLITREGYNGSGDFKVIVRSSDYGTYKITDTRRVINTVLITTKEK